MTRETLLRRVAVLHPTRTEMSSAISYAREFLRDHPDDERVRSAYEDLMASERG